VATATAGTALTCAQAALAGTAVVPVPCRATALAAAITGAVSGETLSLARGCTYELTAALPAVHASLAIRGNGAAIERSFAAGTPDFSLLLLLSGTKTLAVSNLSFRNGDDPTVGGAIDNFQGSAVTVDGGTFAGNTAGVGGAIANTSGGTLIVRGAHFTGNSAGDGGAIANIAGATVTGSVFTGNTALFGGAIYNDEGATMAVTRSQFRDDQASSNGGGIYNDYHLAVAGSRITGNGAARLGGGIFNETDGIATVTGTTISRNHAGFGGGIDNEDAMTVTDSTIALNSGAGGGIYTDWLLAVTDSRITRNTGGGLYNGNDWGQPGKVTLTRTAVSGNQPYNCEPVNSITGCTG